MGNRICAALGSPAWREIDERWARGEIPTSECARQQFALVRAGAAEVDALVDDLRIDPAFPALAAELRAIGVEVEIASDGFDYYIARMLAAAGVADTPYIANHMGFRDGAIQLDFPHEGEGCGHCGTCKGAAVRRAHQRGRRVAYVGDGLSDICAAEVADVLFAKGKLAAHCDTRGLTYHPFDSMSDVRAWVGRRFALTTSQPEAEAAS